MSDNQQSTDQLLSAAVEINRPASEVWAVIAAYNDMYTWAEGIEDTEQLTDAKNGMGAIRINTAKGFGKIEQKITAWVEGKSFTYIAGVFGPLSQTLSTYSVQDAGEGKSRCNLEIAYELQDQAMSGSPAEMGLREKLGAGLHDILGALKLRVETGKQVRPHKSV
jgi:uncharacterized protein YndB with AHSA1/START domain